MSSSNAAEERLAQLLADLLRGLARNLDRDGWLRDPLSGERTPSDHYAQTSAALAWLLNGEPARARRLVEVWCAQPLEGSGHAPFNRLMLILAREQARDQGLDWLEPGCARRAWRQSRLARSYASNNWRLLAMLCRLIEAPSPAAHRRAVQDFSSHLARWTTSAGGFIDFPARPRAARPIATPSAYHHKAVFLTTLALWHGGNADLRAPLAAQLVALLRWVRLNWDERHALAGGLGRSSHALFGDACLLAALRLLAASGVSEAARMLAPLSERLLGQQRPDGLLWLNPAGAESSPRQGWDSYMHLTVYNAWTAALLAWSGEAARDRQRTAPLAAARDAFAGPTPSADAQAGLVRLETGCGLRLWFASGEQAPQGFSRDAAELRYAGGHPVHASLGARLLCPPAVRLPLEDLLRHPALAGWTPLLLAGDRLYGLAVRERWPLDQNAAGLRLGGRAIAQALNRAPSAGLMPRLLSALDWRLCAGAWGRRQALARPSLAGVEARIEWRLAETRAQLGLRLHLVNRSRQTLVYLNPAGHAIIEPPGACRWALLDAQGLRRGRFDARAGLAFPCALPGARVRALAPCRIEPGSALRLILHLDWSRIDG